jgi:polyhydroxyalkanoate synthesis regulator protein
LQKRPGRNPAHLESQYNLKACERAIDRSLQAVEQKKKDNSEIIGIMMSHFTEKARDAVKASQEYPNAIKSNEPL